MEPADERRQHMRIFRVVIVVGAVQVRGHHGNEVGAVLPVITFAHDNARDFCKGIGFVGGLQIPGKQVLLFHGLGAELRVDAGRSEEQQLLGAEFPRGVYHVHLHLHVTEDEFAG